jgi:hypothetical protein
VRARRVQHALRASLPGLRRVLLAAPAVVGVGPRLPRVRAQPQPRRVTEDQRFCSERCETKFLRSIAMVT